MRIHDITLTLRPGIPVWPGDPSFTRTLIWQMGPTGPANVSQVTMSVHTGTHVDAPIHFIADSPGVEMLPLDALVGPCLVCAVHPAGRLIAAEDLDALSLPVGTERLLLKTTNSDIWRRQGAAFSSDFVALSAEGARWIVEHGIRLIGVDYLSVEPFDNKEPVVHRTLLAAGVIALEGVDLGAIAPGGYTLACLPLKLAGSDGAPARAVLIEA